MKNKTQTYLARILSLSREACASERARIDAFDGNAFIPSWLPELEAAFQQYNEAVNLSNEAKPE